MDLTPLTLKTLEAIKRESLDVIDPRAGAGHKAVVAATALVRAVDAECDRRIGFIKDVLAATDEPALPVHTVRGVEIGPEGSPYGVTHDMDCPGCASTPFTASPRSETYWSS